MKPQSLIIAAVFLLTIFSLDQYGKSVRTSSRFEVLRVQRASDAYHALEARGVRGMSLMSFSQRFYFGAQIERDPIQETEAGFPLKVFSLSEYWIYNAGEEDFIRVLMESSMVRKVMHILPDGMFKEALKEASAYEGIVINGGQISIPYYGSPRTISSIKGLPAVDEGAVVFVDSEFFQFVSPQDVADAIGGMPAIVIACECGMTDYGRLTEFIDLIERKHEK